MDKYYYSLGLMSGTSGDGVDASIIQSDGDTKYKVILDRYFEYNKDIYQDLSNLRDKINSSKDLKILLKEIKSLEKKITLFHARAISEIIKGIKINIDFIGLHGQTIFHNRTEKISKQLGDGKLLAQLSKKIVICNFRQNDLQNGGEGAPLTPVFHKLLIKQHKIKLPVTILNIGGIANITYLNKRGEMYSSDIGPGNCLIDKWLRINDNKNYDKDGLLAQSGKVNKVILNQALENWKNRFIQKFYTNRSYDIKDFDLFFVRELSLEDGASTLTEYTSQILADYINFVPESERIIVCGGGRKNKFLLRRISEKVKFTTVPIEYFEINGDFIESQAFAYLAIRSYLNLPISFPATTGVKKPCLGGLLFKS